MLKICIVFWESEPQYAYKHYAYKKNMYFLSQIFFVLTYGIYFPLQLHSSEGAPRQSH